MNVAVTLRACVIDTVQVPVPLQAPLHPANADPEAGDAVSTTDAPDVYDALQLLPQLIPDGLDVTVPLPVPDFATVSKYEGGKVAVTQLPRCVAPPLRAAATRYEITIPGVPPDRPSVTLTAVVAPLSNCRIPVAVTGLQDVEFTAYSNQ